MPAEYVGNRCVSLSELHAVWDCPFVICSTPEHGFDPEGAFTDLPQTPYNAPVMRIVEMLQSVAQKEYSCRKSTRTVQFVNAVDFGGSSSGEWCNTRIRSMAHTASTLKEGKVCRDEGSKLEKLLGKKDFDFFDGSPLIKNVPMEVDELCGEAKAKEKKIEHSFWMCFWRGKVSGGLVATLANMQSKTEKKECCDVSTFGGPMFSHGPFGKHFGKHRTVCMLSVDGGPITQTEKKYLAGIGKSVLSDIRRRQNDWSQECQLMWCHFPSVSDLLKSLNGCKNLMRDFNEGRQIMTDMYGVSSTMRGIDSKEAETTGFSLLDEEICIAKIYQMATQKIPVEQLIDAARWGDTDGIKYLLHHNPGLLKELSAKPIKVASQSIKLDTGTNALVTASFFNHFDTVKALMDANADPRFTTTSDCLSKLLGDKDRAIVFNPLTLSLVGSIVNGGAPGNTLKLAKLFRLESLSASPIFVNHFATRVEQLEDDGIEAILNSSEKTDRQNPVLASTQGFEKHCATLREIKEVLCMELCAVRALVQKEEAKELILTKMSEHSNGEGTGVLPREDLEKVMSKIGLDQKMVDETLAKIGSSPGSSHDAPINMEEFLNELYVAPSSKAPPQKKATRRKSTLTDWRTIIMNFDSYQVDPSELREEESALRWTLKQGEWKAKQMTMDLPKP